MFDTKNDQDKNNDKSRMIKIIIMIEIKIRVLGIIVTKYICSISLIFTIVSE